MNTETAASLLPLCGQEVLITFEKLRVRCRVVDSREVWGRVDVLVEPICGAGAQWVALSRVTKGDNR